MIRSEVLVKVMDEATLRVMSGTERPYEIAIEACADLVHLTPDQESDASWNAYVLWIELTDLVDFLDGPEAEELCNELAEELSRRWLALVDRLDESVQNAFMTEFSAVIRKRVLEYRATH